MLDAPENTAIQEVVTVERLNIAVTTVANKVLKQLVHWEMAQLAEANPSFDEIAKRANFMAAGVRASITTDEQQQRYRYVIEIIEIFEQVAQAIVDGSNDALVDCTIHLEEIVNFKQNKLS